MCSCSCGPEENPVIKGHVVGERSCSGHTIDLHMVKKMEAGFGPQWAESLDVDFEVSVVDGNDGHTEEGVGDTDDDGSEDEVKNK